MSTYCLACIKNTIIANRNRNIIKKVVRNIMKRNMLTYCLRCRKNTENKNAKMVKTKNGRLALSSKYAVCGSKKLRFMKEQEAEGLLSNLGTKAPLSKIPLFGDLLF